MKEKKNALLFFAVVALYSTGSCLVHPVTPTVIKNLHLGDYMFGLALAVMMTTNFLFSPFWGKITSYIGSRTTMLIGCFGYAIGQGLFGFATTQAGVLFARAFSGIFGGAMFVGTLTYIVNTAHMDDRGRYLTILSTMLTVCGSFGYFVGGMIGVWSVQGVFVVQVAVEMLCALLFFVVCKDDSTQHGAKLKVGVLLAEANPFAAFAAGKQFLNKSFVLFFLVAGISNMGFNAFEQVFNYYIKDQYGLSSAYNGMIKAVIGLIALAANATICMWLIRRTDLKKSVIWVLSTGTIAVLGVALAMNPVPFMAISVLYFGVNAVLLPISQDMIAGKAQGQDSNLVMGFLTAVKALGGIFGPLAAGFLYAVTPKLPFFVAFGAMAVSVVFAIWYCKDSSKNAPPNQLKTQTITRSTR